MEAMMGTEWKMHKRTDRATLGEIRSVDCDLRLTDWYIHSFANGFDLVRSQSADPMQVEGFPPIALDKANSLQDLYCYVAERRRQARMRRPITSFVNWVRLSVILIALFL